MKFELIKRTFGDSEVGVLDDGYIIAAPFKLALYDKEFHELKSKTIMSGVSIASLSGDKKYFVVVDEASTVKVFSTSDLEELASMDLDRSLIVKGNNYFVSQDRFYIFSCDIDLPSGAFSFGTETRIPDPTDITIYSLPDLRYVSHEQIDHKYLGYMPCIDSTDLILADKDSTYLKSGDQIKDLKIKITKHRMLKYDDKYYFAKQDGVYILNKDYQCENEITLGHNTMSLEEKDMIRSLKMTLEGTRMSNMFASKSENSLYEVVNFDVTDKYIFILYTHSFSNSSKLNVIDRRTHELVYEFNSSYRVIDIKVDEEHLFFMCQTGYYIFKYSD